MTPANVPAAAMSDTPPPLPQRAGGQSPKVVRALGWVLMVIGPCLSAGMAALSIYLFSTISRQDQYSGGERWNGSPGFTHVVYELFGSIFVLGLVIFAAGLYQARTGRRSMVLVVLTLLVAAVVVYFGCGITGSH